MKKKIVFSLLIGLSVLMGCEKERIPVIFSSRIGNIYKNTNGTEEILLHFEKKKIEVYTNGVRSHSLKYKNSELSDFPYAPTPGDSTLNYHSYEFDIEKIGGKEIHNTTVWLSYITPNSTVEFEDKIMINFYSTPEPTHYFEPI